MTNRILQSDIELARKLLDAGCDTNAVVTALQRRHVDTSEATNLVEGLRQGSLIRPQLPIDLSRCKSRRRHSSRHRPAERRPTVATITPVSSVPLYVHYDHRPVWKRVARKVLARGTATVVSAGLLCCLSYLLVEAFAGARKNAEANDIRDPGWQQKLQREEDVRPDPGYDDLKAGYPLTK
jgi:hypothetical protein